MHGILFIMESIQQGQTITVTTKAAEKVAEFMKQEGNNDLFLRVYVSGRRMFRLVIWYGL